MGGYARFVWPCFAVVFSVLAWNLWRRTVFRPRRAAGAAALAMMGDPQ